MPGTARIGPIEMTGFDGHSTIASAASIASSTPGAGRDSVAPSKRTATTGGCARSRTNHSCMCSSRVAPASPTVIRVRTGSSLIGSSRNVRSHGPTISAVTVGERRAGAQAAGAVEVGREVAITEPEPRVVVVALERVEARERLALETPTELAVGSAGERVGDGIEVGAHEQSVELVVVTGVADDDELLRRDGLHEAREEPRRTDSTSQAHQHSWRVGDALLAHPAGLHVQDSSGAQCPHGALRDQRVRDGGFRRRGWSAA